MLEKPDYTARQFWSMLYSDVLLYGREISPRGKRTLERQNWCCVVHPHQHLNTSASRNVSLDYLRREFLWYMNANDRDIRIAEYAPIWKKCIGKDGRIPSCYGAHIFKPQQGQLFKPFWNALEFLLADADSRRCWIPVIKAEHLEVVSTGDVPCHTGFGFTIRGNKLDMTVHHRSLDMWWGASFDFPVAFLWQQLAICYLNFHRYALQPGPITHMVNSAHFYDRHFNAARDAVANTFTMREHANAVEHMCRGFNIDDLEVFAKNEVYDADNTSLSPLLHWLMDIPGAYGRNDPIWR